MYRSQPRNFGNTNADQRQPTEKNRPVNPWWADSNADAGTPISQVRNAYAQARNHARRMAMSVMCANLKVTQEGIEKRLQELKALKEYIEIVKVNGVNEVIPVYISYSPCPSSLPGVNLKVDESDEAFLQAIDSETERISTLPLPGMQVPLENFSLRQDLKENTSFLGFNIETLGLVLLIGIPAYLYLKKD